MMYTTINPVAYMMTTNPVAYVTMLVAATVLFVIIGAIETRVKESSWRKRQSKRTSGEHILEYKDERDRIRVWVEVCPDAIYVRIKINKSGRMVTRFVFTSLEPSLDALERLRGRLYPYYGFLECVTITLDRNVLKQVA